MSDLSEPEIAVEVTDVTKSFKIPLEASNGLKQKLVNILKGRKGYREFTPLRNISFNVNKGDFFGIVGRNGSGKSTLLKTIAGIYTPNKGSIRVNGTLVPFIELGVGFNPELTGRENVFLNGALLGFSRTEMESMYDEIVDFAELHNFMEERLKNYSSGMQVRLAFSVAIRANADILLLDEVLAVGDEAFQKKCYSYFDQLKRDKKTVILVTHDMSAVERFCNRAMLIEDGKVHKIGRPHIIAAAYSRSNDEGYSVKLGNKAKARTEFDIKLFNESGEEANSFEFNSLMTVRLKWEQENVCYGGVAIFRESGEYVFGPNTFNDKYEMLKSNELEYKVRLNLGEGTYFVKAGLSGKDNLERIAFIEQGPFFAVTRDYNGGRWDGVTKLDHTWT